MKHILPFFLILTILLASTAVLDGRAQGAESIWLSASATAYKAGQTVIVTVNARSGTPIQGFTFQIRYDAACLKPLNAASPIQGMNGLSLPQKSGLVDASFASTTPQGANGVLAEVRFQALANCKTDLVLESAALAIRNAAGYAAPLGGVTTGQKTVALDIGAGSAGAQATQPVVGTPLPLGVEPAANPRIPIWEILTGLAVLLLLTGAAFLVIKLARRRSSAI